MKTKNYGFAIGLSIWLGIVFVNFVILFGVVYTVIHFIKKFW